MRDEQRKQALHSFLHVNFTLYEIIYNRQKPNASTKIQTKTELKSKLTQTNKQANKATTTTKLSNQ